MAEREIELKLLLAPSDVDRFRRDPGIHQARTGRAASKSLLAVYFDTPSLSLKQHKMFLRIRQEGRVRVQTLKTPCGGTGLQIRNEFNAETNAQAPDLALIDDAAVRGRLLELVGDEELEAVVAADIRRTIWQLALDGSQVELALDVGRVDSKSQSLPVCEVELELKSGTPLMLLDFARELADRFRCHVEEASKAARGYSLFAATAPRPKKAQKIKLDPQASIWTTLGRIVEGGTSQLLANEASVYDGGDIEGVHQARVAVRRMRAALSAFRGILPDELRKPLNKKLRRHQVELGPARDWDVFIDETLEPLMALPDAPKGLGRFRQRADVARRFAYRRVHKAMRSARYGRLQLELIRFPYLPDPGLGGAKSILGFAHGLLGERHRAVLEAAGEDPGDLDEVHLHILRINIKKFRYPLEFFVSLYNSRQLEPWRSACKKLQDCIGGLNDAAVQKAIIDTMDAPDRPVPKSVRALIERHNQEKVTEGLSHLAGCWTAFRALKPFWL